MNKNSFLHYGKKVELRYQEYAQDFLKSLGEYTILPVDCGNMIVASYKDGYAVIEIFGDKAFLFEEVPEDGDYCALVSDVIGQMHGKEPKKMKSLFSTLFENAFALANSVIKNREIDDEDINFFEKMKEKSMAIVADMKNEVKEEQGEFYDDFLWDGTQHLEDMATEMALEKLQQKIAASILEKRGWNETRMIFLANNANDLLGNELDMLHDGYYWYEL